MQTHPPNPQTTSINPPKSLLSLPKELMADICSQLDQKTAINMLYVHRSFHQPAESRIYRDITLSIPTYWGEPVLIRPERYGSHEYVAWAKKQAKEVEMAGRAEARRRAEEMIVILSRGAERWRYIRKLVIEPRVEANNAIIQILSLARNYITELEIIKSRDHIYRNEWYPADNERIWSKLTDFGSVDKYSFPNLVKASFHLEHNDCSSIPALLLQRTPVLEEVSIKGGYARYLSHKDEDEDEVSLCDCPFQRTSKFNHLIPPWQASLRVANIDCDSSTENGLPPLLAEQLMFADNLTKVTIRLAESQDDDGPWPEWLEILTRPMLEHLDYDVFDKPFPEALEMIEGPIHSALRTLIYSEPHVQAAYERLEVSLFHDNVLGPDIDRCRRSICRR
jgi:hypothetical protein